jgi:hypothetical protein
MGPKRMDATESKENQKAKGKWQKSKVIRIRRVCAHAALLPFAFCLLIFL